MRSPQPSARRAPREPLPSIAECPTIVQCDQVLRRYAKELVRAGADQEHLAIVRHDIDRWLDLRLALMKHDQ